LISHTLDNWIFGEEQDGDILKESNLRSLIDYCKNTLGEINLVTGDGSIDCLDQPENQEEFVSKLHMAEFIVSLAILADGGSVLLKMFTFFETSSIAILYVLNCCFEELHVFKPATSKEGNSEVYVIGIGYKKSLMTNGLIEKMIGNFKSDKQFLQLDAIPKEFQQQVVEAARFFMNHQVGVIEGNIRTFRRYDKYENDRIKALKWELVEEYVRLYKIAPISEDQKILHGLQVNNDINLNVRVHSGSHSERMIFFHLSRNDQFQVRVCAVV
jgi:cap2 methyltransferase